MKKNIKIIIIIALIVVAISSITLVSQRAISAGTKLKLSDVSFEYPNSIKDVLSLLIDSFYTTVKVTLSNHSDSDYVVNSIYVNAYTLNNREIATQTHPLSSPVVISARKNTVISVKYKMDYTTITKILKDNDMLAGRTIKSFLRDLILYQELGTQLILKGNVTAEGFTIPINEKIDI